MNQRPAERDDWETPDVLFRALESVFGEFDLDAAATVSNSKCAAFYDIEQDALGQLWYGRVWLNPPYGRAIAPFMEQAVRSAEAGAEIVCLIPARVDTCWWHDWVEPFAATIHFFRGRLGFVRSDGKRSVAPFPSALVVFGGNGTHSVPAAGTTATRSHDAGRSPVPLPLPEKQSKTPPRRMAGPRSSGFTQPRGRTRRNGRAT